MFETSHVRAHAIAERRYGLLTLSLGLHTAVIAAIVVVTISSVSLPTSAPRELPAFSPVLRVVIPPPLGRRDVPRNADQPPAQAAVRTTVQSAPRLDVTPDRIPDTIATPATGTMDPNATGNGQPAGRYGDPNGVPDGIATDDNMPTATAADPGPGVYTPGGEVRRAVVSRRVEPVYPRAALASHLGVVVVLQCVIGRDGRIREAHVVRSTMAIFDQAALDALQQWTFLPGVLHGQPVDTYFELTVSFQPR